MSKFLNISTDSTLGGSAPSDELAVSQKAIKTYVDNNSGSTYTAGTGIDITDSTISVTAPTVIDYSTNSLSMMLSKIAQLGSKNYTGVAVFGASACTYANYTLALGYNAQTDAVGAIQLNASPSNRRNQDANTFKVANANGNFEIMSADGTIPEARLADTTNAAQGQVLTLDNNLNAVWASGGGDTVDSVNGKTGVVVLDASDVGALPNTTKYGASLVLSINPSTYVLTATLKDQNGDTLGAAQTVDLPLESVVVSGAYDSATKEVVLTLQSGSVIRFSVADLVSGLQTEITALNMLDADLVDDTNSAHKFVTTSEKNTWNGKQDTISDIATIRSGAALGATAVQPADIDQTYDATSANAQSGVAINNAKFLRNTATNTESLTIYGDASSRRNTINIGAHSSPTGVNSVMIGAYSKAGEGAFAIGNGATAGNYSLGLLGSATANYAYQIGKGTNTETNSLYVGWNSTGNYKLLGSDGLIPDARISSNIARTSDLATVATSGSYNDLSDKPTIPTVGNGTITFTQGGVTKGTITTNQAGNTTIALDAGSVAIDNTTITKNASNEIQAMAVIDQNTGIAKTWTGTQAEYDTIVTKDPETEYIITDDIGLPATEIGQITEALNGKADVSTVAHVVVEFQAPTADNSYTWYRKYADGWVEQGGYMPGQNSGWGSATITLPVPMASRYYYISRDGNWSDASSSSCTITTMTATAFSLTYASNTMDVYGTMWEVKGMAA